MPRYAAPVACLLKCGVNLPRHGRNRYGDQAACLTNQLISTCFSVICTLALSCKLFQLERRLDQPLSRPTRNMMVLRHVVLYYSHNPGVWTFWEKMRLSESFNARLSCPCFWRWRSLFLLWLCSMLSVLVHGLRPAGPRARLTIRTTTTTTKGDAGATNTTTKGSKDTEHHNQGHHMEHRMASQTCYCLKLPCVGHAKSL